MPDLQEITPQAIADPAQPIRTMRLALVGKGGSGKSMICGTLCRILARRGHKVLALDVDTMPGLAMSLGMPLDMVGDSSLPDDLAERVPEKGWVLKEGVEVAELVEKYAKVGPDGVRFLQLGKLPNRVKPGSTVAFRAIMEDFRAEGWTLIGDLAAGTRQPFFGWGDFAEAILIVTEPSAKGALSVRRLSKLAFRSEENSQTGQLNLQKRHPVGLIANKLRGEDDLARLQQHLAGFNLPVLAELPYDEQVAAAEQMGRAPIEAAPDAPAVQALYELIHKLEDWLNQTNRSKV